MDIISLLSENNVFLGTKICHFDPYWLFLHIIEELFSAKSFNKIFFYYKNFALSTHLDGPKLPTSRILLFHGIYDAHQKQILLNKRKKLEGRGKLKYGNLRRVIRDNWLKRLRRKLPVQVMKSLRTWKKASWVLETNILFGLTSGKRGWERGRWR